MTEHELRDLLRQARTVLERYQFDGDVCRDDVAEICMKIDDAFAKDSPATSVGSPDRAERAVA